MVSRVIRICRRVVPLLGIVAIAASVPAASSQALSASAMAALVGGNALCAFAGGVGTGLAISSFVSGGTCVPCDLGALGAGLVEVGCYIWG